MHTAQAERARFHSERGPGRVSEVVFSVDFCKGGSRSAAGARKPPCSKKVLINEVVVVLDHVQRPRGDVDGVVTDALDVPNRQQQAGDIGH